MRPQRGWRPRCWFASGLVMFACTACLDEVEPKVGAAAREICRDDDSDADTTVSFQRDIVERIFSVQRPTRCYTCHDPSSPSPIGVEIAGLNLTSYEKLREGGAISGSSIVVPGQPCQSVLYQKVSEGPPFGSRMPRSGPPFLTEDELQAVHDWIAEGALDN